MVITEPILRSSANMHLYNSIDMIAIFALQATYWFVVVINLLA